MAVTRLGLTGPMADYAAFQAKVQVSPLAYLSLTEEALRSQLTLAQVFSSPMTFAQDAFINPIGCRNDVLRPTG